MPVDFHRSSDGADPLAAPVPHLDDNIAGLARCEPALANLSGSVAISDCGQKDLSADRIRLCGEPLELLSERRLLSAGVFRLSLSHHVHHFDAAQERASATRGLEPHHRANPPLDGPMILLDAIVEVGTLADANGFQITL